MRTLKEIAKIKSINQKDLELTSDENFIKCDQTYGTARFISKDFKIEEQAQKISEKGLNSFQHSSHNRSKFLLADTNILNSQLSKRTNAGLNNY